MKKIFILAAIIMAMVISVNADDTKCNFNLYVESDVESDNLNEDLTFEAWQTLAGINIKYNTAAHRKDNQNGIFYVGDEIHISVYGYFYSFGAWSDDWTSGDPDMDWSRDITLTGDMDLGILVRALDLQVTAYSNDDNLGSALGSFSINNDSREKFKGTDLMSNCAISFFAEPTEGGIFQGWVSDVLYQQMKNDMSEKDFNEWLAYTIKEYEESQTSDEYDPEIKGINLTLMSPYIELDANDMMKLNSVVQLYNQKTGIFALHAIFAALPSGIDAVSHEVSTSGSQKSLRDGKLIITTANGEKFDATGRKF